MKKNEFPSLVADYDEMKLEEWASRPKKRKSHTEQMARWSWRFLRTFLLFFWGVNIAAMIVLAVTQPGMLEEYQASIRLFALLLFLTAMISPEAPAWWIEFYQRWV